jgi:hypothetical protein
MNLRRLALVALGLGWWGAAAQAQQPLAGVVVSQSVEAVRPAPTVIEELTPASHHESRSAGGCSDCGSGGRVGHDADGDGHQHGPALRFVKKSLNLVGLGCWSHMNRPTCSSLWSELTFAFGSCRTWFGEPCLQRAPEMPMPIPPPGWYPPPPLGVPRMPFHP